jgi:hypothetical protein
VSLLKEYVRALVERIRSTGFDIREFRRLADEASKAPDNRFQTTPLLKYADEHLEVLGDGTTRSAYLLSSTKVLKIAQNSKKGVAQNKAEARGFNNPKIRPFVAKIFDHDAKYFYLVSELVRELDTEEEFQRLTGFPWDFFVECLKENSLPEGWEPGDEQLEFWNGIQSLLSADLVWGDIARINHWGKTADGRLVMLDYGYTNKVMQQSTGRTPFTGDANPTQEPPEDPSKVNWNDVKWNEK